MPDINVNTKIGVGAIGKVDNNTSIGTDGLTMCVGVIAMGIPPNGQDVMMRTCAHFSCGFGGPKTIEKVDQVRQRTQAILQENFNIESTWGYVNHTPNDWTAQAIIDACTDFFQNEANPASRNNEAIYVREQGIECSDHNVVSLNSTIENNNAEIDPPQ